jgi:hypothetical protein
LGPTQPPIQWVSGALSQGVNRPGREDDHSPQSSAEVKELVELYFCFPNTPSWRCAQLKKAQRQLYLLPYYYYYYYYNYYYNTLKYKIEFLGRLEEEFKTQKMRRMGGGAG